MASLTKRALPRPPFCRYGPPWAANNTIAGIAEAGVPAGREDTAAAAGEKEGRRPEPLGRAAPV